MARRNRRVRSFDLDHEAVRLYQAAVGRNDFTGAASVLRLLRDLSAKSDEARNPPLGVDVAACTDAELETLDRLLAEMAAWKASVRNRLGLEPTPVPPAATEAI